MSTNQRPGKLYRDSRYPNGVATHTERIAAAVHDKIVKRNAAWISGLSNAFLNSAGEVNITSATINSTINRMKHAENPPITRKKIASERRPIVVRAAVDCQPTSA